MRTAAPEGNWAASRFAALWALVTTSSWFGREAQLLQVLGHLGRAAGRVVGDVQGARADGGQCFDRTFGGFMPAEHGAVEVEQQAIMFLHKRTHVSSAP